MNVDVTVGVVAGFVLGLAVMAIFWDGYSDTHYRDDVPVCVAWDSATGKCAQDTTLGSLVRQAREEARP